MNKPYARAELVIKALYENGPMSVRGLHELLDHGPDVRRTQTAVRKLRNSGLIIPRFSGVPKNAGNFYQLTFRKEFKTVIGKFLNVSPNQLEVPGINSTELIHSQECALWAKRFKQMWPEATVMRDHLFRFDDEAKNTLLMFDDQRDVRPDILLMLPKSDSQHPVRIAVEIERSVKTKKRWLQKLNRLATCTRLDGVIYICSTDGISEAIRRIYQSKIKTTAPRIKHYGTRFLMFSNPVWYYNESGLRMLDAELRATSFERWKTFLVKNENSIKRSEQCWDEEDALHLQSESQTS